MKLIEAFDTSINIVEKETNFREVSINGLKLRTADIANLTLNVKGDPMSFHKIWTAFLNHPKKLPDNGAFELLVSAQSPNQAHVWRRSLCIVAGVPEVNRE